MPLCRAPVASLITLAVALAAAAHPAAAQDAADAPAPPAPDQQAGVAAGAAIPAATDGASVFEPAYFERFAPRNALDMVLQLPGFMIKDSRQAQGPQRGLGQASINVLINSARLASKSESAPDQLKRIPASDVIRIEIVDGATLGIPGLSGQVANIVTRSQKGLSGQFRWQPSHRAHFTEPSLFAGEVSIKGATGAVEYTASVSNLADRGGFGGPYVLTDADGVVLQRRDGAVTVDGDFPKAAIGLVLDGPGSSVGNFNASYQRNYFNLHEDERVDLVDGIDYVSALLATDRGYRYELSADYDFALGPGRLKVIGLERYARGTYTQTARYDYAGASPDAGDRYRQQVGEGEHILRGEYSWKLGKADMQWAAEGAFNRLDKLAWLGTLDEDGGFAETPFPEGSGGVTEQRFENVLTAGYPLADNLSVQTGVGWEYSTIAQTGTANAKRRFWRMKGSSTLSWTPATGFDVTLKVERRVGQLQFGDFLARVFLDNENEQGVNENLVPEQSWDTDLTLKKALGKYGSSQIRLFHRNTQDFVDIIPLEGGGEARGNIDKLNRYGFEWTSTINFDPFGLKGAKLDLNLVSQHSSLVDPVTGETRQLGGLPTGVIDAKFRHDLPSSNWAYGAELFHATNTPHYRVYEYAHDREGPVWGALFVEHKDVMGLTVNARVDNLLGARHYLDRYIFDGPRDSGAIATIERQDRLIGPIFQLTVSGSF